VVTVLNYVLTISAEAAYRRKFESALEQFSYVADQLRIVCGVFRCDIGDVNQQRFHVRV
jgi:hypothetical protein